MSAATAEKTKVWDPVLRVLHWALALLVIANWVLGKFGPDIMTLHFYLGYGVVALLILRIVWGIIGPETARFASFIRGPVAIAGYLRHVGKREPSHWPGHNPLGALSVVAMLLVLVWQVGSGLISDPEDFVNVGPFAATVGSDIATSAVGWHSWGADLILILVLLHIAVIFYYRIWKNEDLIRPMITGWKWVRRR